MNTCALQVGTGACGVVYRAVYFPKEKEQDQTKEQEEEHKEQGRDERSTSSTLLDSLENLILGERKTKKINGRLVAVKVIDSSCCAMCCSVVVHAVLWVLCFSQACVATSNSSRRWTVLVMVLSPFSLVVGPSR